MQKNWTKVNLIIGKRKTGKTTLMLNAAEAYPNRVLVVDTYENPAYPKFQTIPIKFFPYWKSGNKRVIINEDNQVELFTEINKLNYCLVIFEDTGKYLMNVYPKEFARIILDSKNKDNTIVCMFHGWNYIHPKLTAIADQVIVLKNSENIEAAKTKIPAYTDIKAATDRANKSENRYYNELVHIN